MKHKYSKQDVVDLVKGTHHSQTRKQFTGVPDSETIKKLNDESKIREVGEIWNEYEPDGVTVKCIWEQKKGYRIKSRPAGSFMLDYQNWKNSYPKCFGDDCATRIKHRLDDKYRLIYGMCSECAAKFETKMKSDGTWAEFERKQLLANAQSFFNEADHEVKEVVERLTSVGFLNETGAVEKWEGDPEAAKKLQEEYNLYKNLILESLEGKRNDVVV